MLEGDHVFAIRGFIPIESSSFAIKDIPICFIVLSGRCFPFVYKSKMRRITLDSSLHISNVQPLSSAIFILRQPYGAVLAIYLPSLTEAIRPRWIRRLMVLYSRRDINKPNSKYSSSNSLFGSQIFEGVIIFVSLYLKTEDM